MTCGDKTVRLEIVDCKYEKYLYRPNLSKDGRDRDNFKGFNFLGNKTCSANVVTSL